MGETEVIYFSTNVSIYTMPIFKKLPLRNQLKKAGNMQGAYIHRWLICKRIVVWSKLLWKAPGHSPRSHTLCWPGSAKAPVLSQPPSTECPGRTGLQSIQRARTSIALPPDGVGPEEAPSDDSESASELLFSLSSRPVHIFDVTPTVCAGNCCEVYT